MFFLQWTWGNGQEFDAYVRIETKSKDASLKSVLSSLEGKMKDFINETSFTKAHFSKNERIKCDFLLSISSVEGNENFSGELTIQAQRPIYNSSYLSPIFCIKDKNFTFEYNESTLLEYNLETRDNLPLTLMYYLYCILGVDFDTFSSLGGTLFLQQAKDIATTSQSLGLKEWLPTLNEEQNRATFIFDYLNEEEEIFRKFLYDYHRKGLDIMESNFEKGKKEITDNLSILKKVHSHNAQSLNLTFFMDSKLNELLKLYSETERTEKDAVYKLLCEVYPSYLSQFYPLKETF